MHQMAVDVKNGGAVFFGVDNVLVPDLVVKGASHGLCSFVKSVILCGSVHVPACRWFGLLDGVIAHVKSPPGVATGRAQLIG
jgi:hypothetical protein